jgi:5'(3')-deoxyribonucleotidase
MKVSSLKINKTNNLRQYTVLSNEDTNNIKNGRCPNYALWWSKENNNHWPFGHDYFVGNGFNINNDDHKELRLILSEKLSRNSLPEKIVFCDLDGVLADFDQGIQNKLNLPKEKISNTLMWSTINKSEAFFENLPWMPKGRELWDKIKKYDPIVLTGSPNEKSSKQKRNWCERELGEHIHVITCKSRDKSKYCIPDSVLIDDRLDNQDKWKDAGGKFLLYNENSFENILNQLDKHLSNNGLRSP